MRKVFAIIQYPKMIFADYLYQRSKGTFVNGKSVQQLIDMDMNKYIPKGVRYPSHGVKALNFLLASNKIFRTVFYFRIKNSAKLGSSIAKAISMVLVKPLDNIEISTLQGGSIDGGLKINHMSGCVIKPYIAGENLSVFQGVTIGNRYIPDKDGKTGCPILGDNVTIFANSVVFGNIKIGNNVTIGAGSVVTKDIPDNCLVIGNPAKIIVQNRVKVNTPL